MKNNKGLVIVTIILAVLVIILGGYTVYNNFILNDNNCQNNTNENQEKNNNKSGVSKLDNNKAWIHDANYDLPTDKESYYINLTELISASDLIVPYINIDSADAKKANQEIYKLYEELITTFNRNLEVKKWYTLVEYKNYSYNNTVSVVITTESGGTDIPFYTHYTYSFSLDDGKLLSYEEVYKITGFDDNSINSKVERAITTIMKEKMAGFTSDNYSAGTNFDTYNNKSINNYKKSVKNGTIKFFIDGNNKLNIIVTLEIPAGRGQFDTIITVK